MKRIKLTDLTLEIFLKMIRDYYEDSGVLPTHIFMYSRHQANLGSRKIHFKGVPYSEMRGFEFDFKSNWDDMMLLGVGTNKDIEH
tara:strand:- start:479 stop:733 length:255 start_codon:yes stop_codon:yes gene_type:complete